MKRIIIKGNFTIEGDIQTSHVAKNLCFAEIRFCPCGAVYLGDFNSAKGDYEKCAFCKMEKEDDTKKIYTYKCGHESKPVIVDSNELSISAYLEWLNSVGFQGDNTMCWECWCEAKK